MERAIMLKASHAVEDQARDVFGIPVKFEGEEVKLRRGGKDLGDVDVLFQGVHENGSMLHVLLERKRRVGVKMVDTVVDQVLRTRTAYIQVKKIPASDTVVSVLFAEALEPGMVDMALEKDIHVLLDSLELKTPKDKAATA
eukprot:m.151093 g.151093  ORF g.151093 m.151093 type:complete len:141 (+) comp11693_c0_seq11:584-1006(+)